jgi:hypothetical protein
MHKAELTLHYQKTLVENERLEDEDPNRTFVCYLCPKAFASRSGRVNHIKLCHPNEYKDFTKQDQDAEATVQENRSIVSIVQGNHNTVNITSTNHHNHLHIHLKPFGQENTNYLSDKERLEALHLGYPGLNHIVNHIFFNKDHPENHNVKIKSMKHELVLVYTVDDDWEHKPLDEAVDGMFKTSQIEIQKGLTMNDELCLKKMSEINNPTPSLRSHTKKIITAKLVDRKCKQKK